MGPRRRQQRLQHADDGVPGGQPGWQLHVPGRRGRCRPTASASRSATTSSPTSAATSCARKSCRKSIVQGVKFTVHRERPDHSNSQSFPSGHSASAFATAARPAAPLRLEGRRAGLCARLLRRPCPHGVEPPPRQRRRDGRRPRHRLGAHGHHDGRQAASSTSACSRKSAARQSTSPRSTSRNRCCHDQDRRSRRLRPRRRSAARLLSFAQPKIPAPPRRAPDLSVEQIKDFLNNAKVVRTRSTSKGVTAPKRLTLSDGVHHPRRRVPGDRRAQIGHGDGRRRPPTRPS